MISRILLPVKKFAVIFTIFLIAPIANAQTHSDTLTAPIDTTQMIPQETEIIKAGESEFDSLRNLIQKMEADIRADISTLKESTWAKHRADSMFFEVGSNMEILRKQIDSLRGAVRVYDIQEKGLPKIDREVLNILKLPEVRHKVTLKNGTVVVGQILAENLDVIIMQTAIGKLVIEKDFISQYEEKEYVWPKVVLEGNHQLKEFADREEFSGVVKNIGNRRADFVKVIFYLWGAKTDTVGIGSAFIQGKTTQFATGVISDTSLEPGKTATFRVIVSKSPDQKVAYRTHEIKWREFE